MKNTKTVVDSILKLIRGINLELSRLTGVATNIEPAFVGEHKALDTLVKQYMGISRALSDFDCIIHQNTLCLK